MGALERNEFTAVAMRVAQSFGEVTLTASDHAIRIHGCSGSIVAYIPLSARAWANVNAMRLTAAAGLTSGYAGGF
jgi:hypothetical protein